MFFHNTNESVDKCVFLRYNHSDNSHDIFAGGEFDEMSKKAIFLLTLGACTLVFFGVYAILCHQLHYALLGLGLCLGLFVTYCFWRKY